VLYLQTRSPAVAGKNASCGYIKTGILHDRGKAHGSVLADCYLVVVCCLSGISVNRCEIDFDLATGEARDPSTEFLEHLRCDRVTSSFGGFSAGRFFSGRFSMGHFFDGFAADLRRSIEQ